MIHNSSTHDFMHLAYQACFTGSVLQVANDEVRREMVKVVLDDLCTTIRTFPKNEQSKFLTQMQHRLAGGN